MEYGGAVAVIGTTSVIDSDKFSCCAGLLGCDIEPNLSISIVATYIVKNMSEDGVFDSKVEYGGAVAVIGTSSVVNLCDDSSWYVGFLGRDAEPVLSIFGVYTDFVKNMSEDGIFDNEMEYSGTVAVVGSSSVIDSDKFS